MTECGSARSSCTRPAGDLLGSPPADGVGHVDVGSVDEREQFAVGVAADQHYALPQRDQPIQDGDGLRPGGVVASDDDAVGIRHLGHRQYGVEGGQHAVHIGQHRDRFDHLATLPGPRLPA